MLHCTLLIASCHRLRLSIHVANYNHQQKNYKNKTMTVHRKELRMATTQLAAVNVITIKTLPDGYRNTSQQFESLEV